MRKLAAIFLLFILLFNAIGYKVWFYYAERKSDRQLEARLDRNQYKDEDLLTLKIPLNIPYQLNESQFERIDGEISLDGKLYKYVKRRVSEGNLILLCIPDIEKMTLKNAKTGYGTPAAPVQKKITVSEYEEAPAVPVRTADVSITFPRSCYQTPGLADVLIAFPGKPPEVTA
ncbi:MAG: hypothetical protein ABUL46_01170 [Chitinophaga rupis]